MKQNPKNVIEKHNLAKERDNELRKQADVQLVRAIEQPVPAQ